MTEPDPQEFSRRVVYSLLRPAVRLSKVAGLSMEELSSLVRLAYYQELRGDGLTLQDTASFLDLSMRSVARLSKLLKTNFFAPDRAHELPRRIEFALWYEPLSLVRIARELSGATKRDVEEAVQTLLLEGRITENKGRTTTYGIARTASRIVREGWVPRIGALNSLSSNIASVVYTRFFSGVTDSFARTLSLRVREKDLPELRRLYDDVIWPTLEALDAQTTDDQGDPRLQFSVLWAPYEAVPGVDAAGLHSDEDN